MSTWNNLSMREKAAYMLAAVRNGYRDLDSIRSAYNKFAEGGASGPNLVNNATSASYVTMTGNKDVDDTFNTTANYLQGNVAQQRVNKMFNTLEAANAKLNNMRRLVRGFQRKPERLHLTEDSSMGGNNQVFVNPNEWGNTLNGASATTLHEFNHNLYSNIGYDILNFSPDYLSRFNNFGQEGKASYSGIYEGTPSNINAEWNHDNNKDERIPFIKEVQEDMRKQGLWDYTTGDKLSKEKYEEYLKLNPKARTQYWNKDDATWLLNNTASIDLPKADDYTNLAAYGGGLNSPFSHSAIPAVRYAEGGNLFLEGGPEGFWDKLDRYAENAEAPLSLANLGAWTGTMLAPNPVTPIVAYGTSLVGAGVDAYQAARSAIKGDYKDAAWNLGEVGLGLLGASGAKAIHKGVRAASKAAKATKATTTAAPNFLPKLLKVLKAKKSKIPEYLRRIDESPTMKKLSINAEKSLDKHKYDYSSAVVSDYDGMGLFNPQTYK